MSKACSRHLAVFVLTLAIQLGPGANSAPAWGPNAQAEMAAIAASIGPADLHRQILRHQESYQQGVATLARQGQGHPQPATPVSGSDLQQMIARETDRTIEAIHTAIHSGRWFQVRRLMLSLAEVTTDSQDTQRLRGQTDKNIERVRNYWRLLAMNLIGAAIWLATGWLALLFGGGISQVLGNLKPFR